MNIADATTPGVHYLSIPGTSSSPSRNNPTSSTSSSSSNEGNGSNTLTISNNDGGQRRRRRSRGLSLSLVDIVSSTTSRNKRNSTSSNHSAPPTESSTNVAGPSSSPPSSNNNNPAAAGITTQTNHQPLAPRDIKPSQLSIEIEGGQQLIIRPNRIIRGTVILKATSSIQAAQIRIKFRAEEVGTVRIREPALEWKSLERIDQLKRTYFEVDTKVWGNEASDFSVKTWETLEPGEHRYPFALKFPNVNFPPSVDDPTGFSIHYIWSAHLDGAGFQPGLRSREHVLPYRPIICAPPSQEWTVSETLYKSEKTPMARVTALLPQHVFCPDEPFHMHLHVECIPSDMIVVDAMLSLKKHYEGKVTSQQGTAYKTATRSILRSSLSVTGNDGTLSIPIQFQMPTRLVSPSFASKNIRVYYSLTFHIQCEYVGRSGGLITTMKRPSSWTGQFSIPIAIANLPNDHLLRIPELTSIHSYSNSNEPPVFFDPSLEEPPLPNHHFFPSPRASQDFSTAAGGQGGGEAAFMMMNTPPPQSPPNYFSLPSMPSIRRERVEKVSFTSRLIKAGFAPEYGDAVTYMADVFDDEW